MKVFVVGPATGYARFLEDATLVKDMKEAEVVLFTGGEDIDPSFYGCEKFEMTYSNIERDKREIEAFKQVRPDQLVVGICRGLQLSCVMYGGKLVQHCHGHSIGRTHEIDNGERLYEITSIHHQMVYPYDLPKEDYDILFRSSNPLSGKYYGDKIDSQVILDDGEPEIVVFHREGLPTCLGIQGHPEMMPRSAVSKMINDLIRQLLDK